MDDVTASEGFWLPVANDHQEPSVWPAHKNPPSGWRPFGTARSRAAALDCAAAYAVDRRRLPHADPPGVDLTSTVDRRFHRRAVENPAGVAILESAKEVTYEELLLRVTQARAGLEHRGVHRGALVGVRMRRGADLVAVLLAILSSGAAYLPLDASYPPERTSYIVDDAKPLCVVCDSGDSMSHLDARVPVVLTRDLFALGSTCEPSPAHGLDDLAYVIYTSGSTGRPKGVEITHRNLTAFLAAMGEFLPREAVAKVLFSTRLSFDIAGLEIYFPLVNAGTCVISPESELLNARSLARLVNSVKPSLIQATPVGWRLLLDAGAQLASTQLALCGGEALPPSLAKRLASLPARFFNMYGPTEASVWSTAWPVQSGTPAIGTPLAHARVYMLDDYFGSVAVGSEGEAYIAGPAVARGYRGNPRLTAERFLPDPWSALPGGRMYATGDIVRVVNAELEWLRRSDDQVKINGHRIELMEIESVAAEVPGVLGAAAVVTGGSDSPAITLYIAVGDSAPDMKGLVAARLAEALPPVMIPRHIRMAQELPLSVNGKIDRLSLKSRAEEDAP